MPTNIIPFIEDVSQIADNELYTNYYSYDSIRFGSPCTKYILKSTIDYYTQNPVNAIHLVTSEHIPLLHYALSIERNELVTKLINVPECDIFVKNADGNDIIQKLKNDGALYKYYFHYPAIIDALLKRGVNISSLIPDKKSEVAKGCFKSGTPYLLNFILDTKSLNSSISSEYKFIVNMFISNVTMNQHEKNDYNYEEYDENVYLNIFSKLLKFIPDNSLENTFIDMCKHDITPFILMVINESKVNINHVKSLNGNPLTYSVKNGNLVLTEIFLSQFGIDPNVGDVYGYPMTSIARGNNIAMVKLLKQYGASLKVKDILGRTPYDLAKQYGNGELLYHVTTKPMKKYPVRHIKEFGLGVIRKFGNKTSTNESVKRKVNSNQQYNTKECAICMETSQENLFLVPCGHGPIGSHCVNKLINKKCPFCSSEFTSTVKIHVV